MTKKISDKVVDKLIKCLSLGLLYVIAVITMVFSLLSLPSKSNVDLGNAYTANVYISPYSRDSNFNENFVFDQSKERDDNKWKPCKDDKEQEAKISSVINNYSNRLYLLGYQQPHVNSKGLVSVTTTEDGLLNKSWLIDGGKSLCISMTMGAPNNIAVDSDVKADVQHEFISRFVNKQINISNQMSLETTDGVVVFSDEEVSKKTIVADSNVTKFGGTSSRVEFEIEKNNHSKKSSLLGQIFNLIEDPNNPLEGVVSSFNTPSWSNLPFDLDQKRTRLENGDRILVLWNTKYAAVNYARELYYTYQNCKGNPEKEKCLDKLNDLEKKFAKFLYSGEDETKSVSIEGWKGFQSVQEINQNTLGYFCFKQTNPIDDPSVELTDYAPLFSSYILTFFRAQTGTKNKQEGVKWTNTGSFTSFFSKPNVPTNFVKVKMTEMYLPSIPMNLAKPSASLEVLKNATASNIANSLKTAFDSSTLVLQTSFDFSSDSKVDKHVYSAFSYPLSSDVVSDSAKTVSISSLVGIGVGVILIILAVFMTFFYRIIGLMSWFGMILGLSVSFFLFFKFLSFLNFAAIFGLFIAAILNVFSYIYTFEVFRRRFGEMMPAYAAFNRSLRQSIMPVIDLHMVVLFFSVPLLFIGKYVEQGFSIALIIGTFFSFFVSYFFTLLTIKLFLSIQDWKKSRYLIFVKTSGNFLKKSKTLEECVDLNTIKINWFSKKHWWLLLLFLAFLVFAIVGFWFPGYDKLVFGFAVGIVSKNVLFASLFSLLFSFIYLFFRLRWTAAITFVTTMGLLAVILLGCPLILLLPTKYFGMNDVVLLAVIYLLMSLTFVLSINLQNSYYQNKYYDLNEFRLSSMLSMSGCFLVKMLMFGVILIIFNGFFIAAVCNKYPYSSFLLNEILLYNVIAFMAFLVNFYFTPYVFVGLMKVRNHFIKKQRTIGDDKHGKHEWSNVNYDSCDEQLIVGINSRR